MSAVDNQTVTLTHHDGIACVKIDNPPVNALNQKVRSDLERVVTQVHEDATVRAVVVQCAGKTFVSGADIRELGKPALEPHLPDVLNAIESSTVPWIAAIKGTALGGGLEIAMACHARIAMSNAKMGMPEVSIGIIPGAGGTARLPRLVPMQTAIKMVTTGKPITAPEAFSCGLIDILVDDNLETEAMSFAERLMDAGRPAASSERALIDADQVDWDVAKTTLLAKSRGAVAPVEALENLKKNTTCSAVEVMTDARERFLRLGSGIQSAALRYAFFAERAAGAGMRSVDASSVDLSHVGVIGGGTMGAGIAVALLLSGSTVCLVERDAEAAQNASVRVEQTLEASLKRGVISQEKFKAAFDRLTTSFEYSDLVECELVIEAVFENMDVKVDVFKKLDAVMPTGAILATNTSYLDINILASKIKYPERILGLHFFSPAHVMKLLEIVKGDVTGAVALATGAALAKRLRKVAVLAGVCDGFIGNRVMAAYRRECEFMLEEGATPGQIDSAMRNFGFAMGIYEVQDMSGLDIAWAQRKAKAANRPADERYAHIADRLCEAGRLGRKTGKGWYNYEDLKAGVDDPEVLAIIVEERVKAGYDQQAFSEEEIMDRILKIMQNEGAALLEEGIAECADDIDVVMVTGYGFPRHRGGPMFMLSAS